MFQATGGESLSRSPGIGQGEVVTYEGEILLSNACSFQQFQQLVVADAVVVGGHIEAGHKARPGK